MVTFKLSGAILIFRSDRALFFYFQPTTKARQYSEIRVRFTAFELLQRPVKSRFNILADSLVPLPVVSFTAGIGVVALATTRRLFNHVATESARTRVEGFVDVHDAFLKTWQPMSVLAPM